ncbi:hypothetical protein [Rhodococcus sp. IEGM 1379]|uniref:hypothetical protein n=1 Tax=Rhodococcus sp. IEGM 1379 TaxID=3047086 RepID=UPI0024B72CBE|nr:hypothetical protein [Rhodococcus sp. IEGM 1379]
MDNSTGTDPLSKDERVATSPVTRRSGDVARTGHRRCSRSERNSQHSLSTIIDRVKAALTERGFAFADKIPAADKEFVRFQSPEQVWSCCGSFSVRRSRS